MAGWTLLLGLALGSTWDDVLRADDLANSGRPEEAVAQTGALLAKDPGNLGAQYVHIAARTRGMREGREVEVQYRRWLEEAPTPAAKFGLAAALTMAAIPERNGPWCEEVESLIGGPVTGPGALWVLRLRIDARRHCPADPSEDVAALVELGKKDDLALAWSIRERTRGGRASEAVASDFERLVKRAPELASETAPLLMEALEGEGVARVRAAQLASQRELVGHAEPRVVAYAATALSLAGDQDGARSALTHLTDIDPVRSWSVPTSEGLTRWYLRDKAQRVGATEEALEVRLRKVLNPTSDDAAVAALKELRGIWERDPRDSGAAYAFARGAAALRMYEDLAGGALDYSINSVPAWDPRGASRAAHYDQWRSEANAELALWLSERGWLRRLVGRPKHAAEDLRLAILLTTDPPAAFHLRLGLVYYDEGFEEAALHHLGRGLGMEGGDAHRVEARRAAEDLYSRLTWAPGGLDGWIADQAAARQPYSGEPPK